jgi:3-oxosteroid 1-dehydrogenase
VSVAGWDADVDLVVVGSGAAALTGALVAAAEGAEVLLLEKTSLIGGTTAVSGGGFWIPLNHHMTERGLDDSREEALAYIRACAGEQGDDDLYVALVDHGADMVRYLEDNAGCTFRAYPTVAGTVEYRPWLEGTKHGARTLDAAKFEKSELGDWAAKVRTSVQSDWTGDKFDNYAERYNTLTLEEVTARRAGKSSPAHWGSGTALVAQLLRGCLAHGVGVNVDSRVEELIVEDGAVVGVHASREGRPYAVRARHGVLLGTGGYGGSSELKRLWLNRPLEMTCEIAENTGDGHLMGMSAGAQVANLGDAWFFPFGASRDDRVLPHSLIVNTIGRRFVNESTNYNDFAEAFGNKEGAPPRNNPAWFIFDSQGARKYSALTAKLRGPDGELPATTFAGETLDELAAKIGVDPAGLQETVERFNGFARDGKDRDFLRGENPFDIAWGDPGHEPNPALGTVEEGPFYSVQVIPGALATKGGLRVNDQGQVLSVRRPFGPIPGLYAAGNCSNAGVAGAYPAAGATIGAAMTFGYIIARHAVAAVTSSAAALTAGYARSGSGSPAR